MFFDKFEATKINPEEFEIAVKNLFKSIDPKIKNLKIKHRKKLEGTDGIYEIDICLTFELFGTKFLVLVECKHHKNPIKREVVQVLYDRVRSIGAQKGIIFSTSNFQKGALEYATTNGIALIRFVEGKLTYETRSISGPSEAPPWANIPKYVGYLITRKDDRESYTLVSEDISEYFRELFDTN